MSLDIGIHTEVHKKIIEGCKDRVTFSKNRMKRHHDKWNKAEEAAMAYMPERDVDAQRRTAREGGMPQYTTIVLPYSYGMLMAAHTYWTTVFMARNPVLQYEGRHGETVQKTQAVEALMDYQVQVGQMLVPWYTWLYDGGKYGIGLLGMFWEDEVNTVSSIEEVEVTLLGGVIKTGKFKKRKITKKLPGYSGNKVHNIRPQDFFPDPRVPVSRLQDGEFCAIYTELSWNVIISRAEQGFYINIHELDKKDGTSGLTGESNSREPGSSVLELPEGSDAGAGASAIFDATGKKVSSVIKAYEVYIDLIPKKWGLGKGEAPEKWVFTVDTGFKVVIGAQPLGAYHNKFPINVIEYEPEGYALVNRGIPDVAEPIERTLNWLVNSHFYNVRKALNDQFIIDPSRVVMKDAQNPLPGGLLRLKPEAYGSDTRTVMTQLQVTDVTRGHLADMREMDLIGQKALGINEQIMGALRSTGRKTATEVRTSSTFGVNRLKTNAEYFSAMGWAPMSAMMVQNSQQYYDGEKQFKIVGDLIQEAGQEFMQVTPEDISGFYNYVPIDGTLPIDRLAQAALWKDIFAQMRQMPEITMQYDTGRIFAWVAQLAGIKNINQFKIQTAPDASVAAAAAAGNLVPIDGGGGGKQGSVPSLPKQLATGPVA
jgi:hypothetical protein